MSDDPTPLENIPPLGKSVEEIEADASNRDASRNERDSGGIIERLVPSTPPVNTTGTWPGDTAVGASTPEVPVAPIVQDTTKRRRDEND